MSRIGALSAHEHLFRILFEHIVGVVGTVTQGHAAPGMRGSIDVSAVETAIVKNQYSTARHGHGQGAVIQSMRVKVAARIAPLLAKRAVM